ncbi:hypothetical protein D9M68_743340 [compost metagenome]
MRQVIPSAVQLFQQVLFYLFRQEFIKGLFDVLVHFIKDQYNRFIKCTNFLQGFVHNTDLVFIFRMRNIHDMQQDVCLSHLIQCRFEAFYKVMRQLTDKSNRIAQEERRLLKHYFTGSGFQRCKQLIFCKYIRLTQYRHQRTFTHICIAHQGYADKGSSLLALSLRLFVNLLESLAQ